MSRRIFFSGLLSKVPFQRARLLPKSYTYYDHSKVVPLGYDRKLYLGVTLSFQEPESLTPSAWDFKGALPRANNVLVRGPCRTVEPSHTIPFFLDYQFGIQKAQVDVHDHYKLGEFFKGTGLFTGTPTLRYVEPVPLSGAECFEGHVGAICDSSTSPCTHLVQSPSPGLDLEDGAPLPGDEIFRQFVWFAPNKGFTHFDNFWRTSLVPPTNKK